MKNKATLGGIGVISLLIMRVPVYNYYSLPVIRHKELIDKIYKYNEPLKKNRKITT
jgi:hypothetical protein